MEILDIKYKKSGSAVLTLENSVKVEIDGDDVYNMGYKKGATLTQGALSELIEMGDDYFAYKKAISAVAMGDVSRAGLMQKLRQKGAKQESAEKAVQKVCNMGFVDEQGYAERLCETYGGIKHFARRRVMQELYAHGIERDMAQLVAETALPDDRDNIERYWQAKLTKTDLSDEKSMQKAISNMLRAGYSYDVINSFLRTL